MFFCELRSIDSWISIKISTRFVNIKVWPSSHRAFLRSQWSGVRFPEGGKSLSFFLTTRTSMRVFSGIKNYQRKKKCWAPLLGLAKSIYCIDIYLTITFLPARGFDVVNNQWSVGYNHLISNKHEWNDKTVLLLVSTSVIVADVFWPYC